MAETTDTLRRFNRTWTQRVGVLEESFLGTGRPLGVSRLLFEAGPDGATAPDLLIRAATVHLRNVPPDHPAAVAAVGRYFGELDERFPGGFDPGDSGYAGAPAGQGAFVVATSDGRPVACGGVVPLDATHGDRV